MRGAHLDVLDISVDVLDMSVRGCRTSPSPFPHLAQSVVLSIFEDSLGSGMLARDVFISHGKCFKIRGPTQPRDQENSLDNPLTQSVVSSIFEDSIYTLHIHIQTTATLQAARDSGT